MECQGGRYRTANCRIAADGSRVSSTRRLTAKAVALCRTTRWMFPPRFFPGRCNHSRFRGWYKMADSSIARPAPRTWTSRCAHVFERIGLAMAGASCGLFVAAHVTNSGVEAFGSLTFVFALMVFGATGFYLGIDIPPPRSGAPAAHAEGAWHTDPVELFSGFGTFLAATAALMSVYIIVFDAEPPASWSMILAICWMAGGIMQIIAGTIARWRT